MRDKRVYIEKIASVFVFFITDSRNHEQEHQSVAQDT